KLTGSTDCDYIYAKRANGDQGYQELWTEPEPNSIPSRDDDGALYAQPGADDNAVVINAQLNTEIEAEAEARDAAIGAAVTAHNSDPAAHRAGITALIVGQYSLRNTSPADIYIRDDLYTFSLPSTWKNSIRAYAKNGFVYISGYIPFAASNPVVPKFGAEVDILTLGNAAYTPVTGVDYCGTAGDYHSDTGASGLSLSVMMRYNSGNFRLGQTAPTAAQTPFLGYILVNIMYPLP
ncbi:MAG: hypothetical protein LBB94_10425, partial [Clostridiales bacterium]|nr:hypothetical protein [Clostridiales bacterium]